MFANLTGWHFLIIVLVVMLLFGATRLPALAKAVGQSAKIFRREMQNDSSSESRAETPGVTSAEEVAVPVAASTGAADPS